MMIGNRHQEQHRMNVRQQFELTGKSAVVTGGSRGLGLEIAQGLGEAGARVLITARRAQWLDPAAAELREQGIDCTGIPCDVTQADQVQQVAQQARERFGRVDILVNNAGVSWGQPFEEVSLERWRMVVETNLTGTFLMTQAVGRGMIEDGGGKILNVASVAGLLGVPETIMQTASYHASKGGVIALTRDLAIKWAKHNISINAVAPGFFPTRMTEHLIATVEDEMRALSPFGRLGREGELKGVAVFLCSAASNWITGQVLAVDGGYTAW
jgi:NAD(P)-dependent dehydrogenase (short-subunit alcohol dehydrogenase family)